MNSDALHWPWLLLTVAGGILQEAYDNPFAVLLGVLGGGAICLL